MLSERVWQTIEASAQGFGYDLVDLDQTPAGILRVFIDVADGSRLITVDDCEALSNQLVHELPVEGIEFSRLEVSSPGFDRRLRTAQDFTRFAGQRIKLRLRRPMGNRRNFEGPLALLEDPRDGARFQVLFEGAGGETLALDFDCSDVDEARLVPDFPKKEKRR
ncbi:MAG: ribosome maturation factor RimP [Burkholderiaceae bacterium]|jgi:ribosome maturation factor RimP